MTKTVRDVFSVIGLVFVIITICLLVRRHTKIAPTIIETDTIVIKRDSLIKQLKDIEHEESKVIKEVMVLDNDSTLKLFKVLVSE